MQEYMTFSYRLRQILNEKNMTQKELAKLSGLTEASVSRYLSGNRVPKAPQIVLIAKTINVSTDYLLGLEKNENG